MVASRGEPGRRGRKNEAAVNKRGAVSPAARSSPRIIPVRIPGRAWGRIIRRIVCHFVPPNDMLTTRNDWGTDRKDSSAVLMIMGKVMIEGVRDPASKLTPT